MTGELDGNYSTDEYDLILEDGTIAPERPTEVKCGKCGGSHLHTLSEFDKRIIGTIFEDHRFTCPDCIKKIELQGQEDVKRQREEAWIEKWNEVCPPLYRRTDLSRLPKAGLEAIQRWAYNDDGIGVGIIGAPGKCKTRLIYELGRRIHMDKKKVKAISSTDFSALCSGMFTGSDDNREHCEDSLHRIKTADFLIFDDIGKQKFTERVEMEFFGLLELRTSYLLPTFWTANAGSKELSAMMSRDRAEAIIRRLTEFSTIITL